MASAHRIYGIETEYGIAVDGRGANDLVQESIALVRSYAGSYATGWNYRGEDPRRDMRGFTVDRLSSDPDDAQFDEPGRPPMTMAEERSDRILANGARLYNDHGHPEYSTPECSNLLDLVAHDRAGERIVWECAERYAKSNERSVSLFKNNTDYHGASYGTHECYLMRRDVPPDALIQGLIPFFVTRQIFAGSGKVTGQEGLYQLSQRADFFDAEASVDTLHNRPLVNTRDEPHATPRKYRRLHVIIGDANMSEWATALKVGATSLVISLLEDGWQPGIRLKNPTNALKSISRDQSLQWLVELDNGRSMYAIDIQRLYLNEARRRFCGRSRDDDWSIMEWDLVLGNLADDIMLCADRVDWVAKRHLLEHYMAEEKANWDAPVIESLDLAYHDVDRGSGLYYGLEMAGQVRRLVSDARIQAAMECPPSDTRAFIRGLFARRFGSSVRSIGWNGVAFRYEQEDLLFDMNPLVEDNVQALNEEFASASSLADVVAVIRRKPDEPDSIIDL